MFFSSSDSVVGDSLEFNQANRGSLRVWSRKRNSSGHNAGESGLISQGAESLMDFLELRQEPGLYSRVTAGMSIRNCSLFIEVRNLSRYEGQLRNVNQAWQENTDASGSEVGVQVSFSIWHSDIGIPNYIKKLSGIVKIWSSELHVAF